MPSIDESRLAERACQLRTSKRVVEHQLPLARLEANGNLLILLDPLAHHRSFLTPRISRGAKCRRLHAQVRRRTSQPPLQRDHSMTRSALLANDCGIVSPSAFGVFRLMTSSNLVGCSTGSSPGLTPLRILST